MIIWQYAYFMSCVYLLSCVFVKGKNIFFSLLNISQKNNFCFYFFNIPWHIAQYILFLWSIMNSWDDFQGASIVPAASCTDLLGYVLICTKLVSDAVHIRQAGWDIPVCCPFALRWLAASIYTKRWWWTCERASARWLPPPSSSTAASSTISEDLFKTSGKSLSV